MLCELSLLFNKKEGVKEQFPEFTENSFCEKLWNHLDNRELRDFKVEKNIKKYFFIAFPKSFSSDCQIKSPKIYQILPKSFFSTLGVI